MIFYLLNPIFLYGISGMDKLRKGFCCVFLGTSDILFYSLHRSFYFLLSLFQFLFYIRQSSLDSILFLTDRL